MSGLQLSKKQSSPMPEFKADNEIANVNECPVMRLPDESPSHKKVGGLPNATRGPR